MTSPDLPIDTEDKPINKSIPAPSFQVYLTEITLDNLDSGDIRPKGYCGVLPSYNDEAVIGSVVLRTKQYVDHVIVVDDGSTDRTADIAKFAGAEVIHVEHTMGKTYAILLVRGRYIRNGRRIRPSRFFRPNSSMDCFR